MGDTVMDLLRNAQIEKPASPPGPVSADGACLADLFEAQVKRTPDAFAFVFAGLRFTYAELDVAANQMARLLIARGVGPEMIVGLLLPRSPQLLIALLAIVKAGAAYLPLDPDYPSARLLAMLQDGEVAQILTTSDLSRQLELPANIPALLVDLPSNRSDIEAYPTGCIANAERISPLSPHNLLYVIYTSGSTGKPKGVAVEHRSFVHLMQAMVSIVKLSQGETFLALSTICFDPAGMEIFIPLLQGGCLVMLNGADTRDPVRVAQAVREKAIVALATVPTFMRALIASDIPRTVLVIMGGEAIPSSMVPHLLQFPLAINLYGPTETTVLSSFHTIMPEDAGSGASVPLGRPLKGEQFYILDERLLPVAPGCAGELHIAGAGLARGYLNRPQLTAERFVDCPFGSPGKRMYKTGDLARFRPDGNVEFLGRIDQQIKIRGFRIEPGEIESTILRVVPAIRECVVVARDFRGQARLVAYHVNIPGSRVPAVNEIRAMLSASLPDHMVPRHFMRLDRMPVTPSEKLDRQALPQPEEQPNQQSHLPPVGPAEIAICRIFRELTGAPRVGRDDDFFQIGGNSLAAVLSIHRLRRDFNREVTLRQLFGAPTPRTLAQTLAEDGPPATLVAPALQYPTLFLLPGLGGDVPQLVRFRMEWEGIARIVSLDFPNWTELLASDTGIHALLDHCLRRLLEVQPDGPVWLLGYSLGGNLAHAIALHLAAQGREVAFVGLLDSDAHPPLSNILAAELQAGVSPLKEGWLLLQDFGRVLRAIPQRNLSQAVALMLARRLTTPWARPLLASAARHYPLPLPLKLSYHLDAYLNEARHVAAMQAWCTVGRDTAMPLAIPAFLFRSESHQPGDAVDLGWQPYFPLLTVTHLPGDHKTMFDPPHLKTLFERIRAVINILYSSAFATPAFRNIS
jgi:nonribosomal peptide synthetase DhbF